VAAYQMAVGDCYGAHAVARIREQLTRCEASGVEILCCPEGALGGLADYVDDPPRVAIDAPALGSALAPLASPTVTTIVGFTEAHAAGRLYNAAAVLRRGAVLGVYRKRHPAIRSSRYAAGTEAPLFTLGGLTFGVLMS
jgi:5-aminopentanamidase